MIEHNGERLMLICNVLNCIGARLVEDDYHDEEVFELITEARAMAERMEEALTRRKMFMRTDNLSKVLRGCLDCCLSQCFAGGSGLEETAKAMADDIQKAWIESKNDSPDLD